MYLIVSHISQEFDVTATPLIYGSIIPYFRQLERPFTMASYLIIVNISGSILLLFSLIQWLSRRCFWRKDRRTRYARPLRKVADFCCVTTIPVDARGDHSPERQPVPRRAIQYYDERYAAPRVDAVPRIGFQGRARPLALTYQP